VQYFKFAKTETMNQQQERQKSDAARIRHDNRQTRQDLEKQEKAQRQQQRKAALASSQQAKHTKGTPL
jgi:electron transport complex protein RnfC